MSSYFLLLGVPSLLAACCARKRSHAVIFLIFSIFVLFVGLRYEVGGDRFTYEMKHLQMRGADWHVLLETDEPLSYFLFWTSENIGLGMLQTNVIAAIILMIGVFSIALKTPNPWLSIVSATPYFIIVFGMSGIRQSIAAAILLYMLSQWNQSGSISKSIWVVFASLFHNSALFGGLFVVYGLKKVTLWAKVALGGGIGGIGYYLLQRSEATPAVFDKYYGRYVEDPEQVVSRGVYFHLAIIGIPAVLAFLYQSRIRKYVFSDQLLTIGIFGGLALMALNPISTTVVSRLTLYFYFVPMMVYPALVHIFLKRDRHDVIILFILAHFAMLGIWLFFANNAHAFLPYQNWLLVS